MIEADLRKWFRKLWPAGSLAWTEAGLGGTVGLPDLEVPLGSSSLKIELKHWHRNRKGVCFKMRPAQIRYHFMEARAGRRTAIVGSVGELKTFDICVINGAFVPKSIHDNVPWVLIPGMGAMDYERARKLLEIVFTSETFWQTGLMNEEL